MMAFKSIAFISSALATEPLKIKERGALNLSLNFLGIKSQLLDIKSQLLDNKSQLLDNKSQLLDNKSQLLDNKSQLLDNKSQRFSNRAIQSRTVERASLLTHNALSNKFSGKRFSTGTISAK